MRPANKSRNRGKSGNRRGTPGNNINRVFESSGPEGRVRGTPQQIIDKYTSLTHDAQLSGDRVAAENFQQHAEHYSRLLIEAQKELLEKQSEQQASYSSYKAASKSEEIIAERQEKKALSEHKELIQSTDEATVLDFENKIDKTPVKKRKSRNTPSKPAQKKVNLIKSSEGTNSEVL